MSQQEFDGVRRVSAGHSDMYGAESMNVQLLIARVEAKIDMLVSTQKLRDDYIVQAIHELRETVATRFAALEKMHADLETRVRTIEQRRYVEPKTVWTAVGTFTGLAAVVLTIISIVTR